MFNRVYTFTARLWKSESRLQRLPTFFISGRAQMMARTIPARGEDRQVPHQIHDRDTGM